MKPNPTKPRFHWTPARALVGSFLAVTLLGGGALLLPGVSAGPPLKPIDALFTSTSAVCVTGLVVVDTPVQFTRLGQWILLLLIQMGGLGILTFATWILMFSGRTVGVFERSTATSTLGSMAGVRWRSVLYFVLIWTAVLEGIGTGLLYWRWRAVLDPGEALFQALFHSVSAFCNAGFSTWPGGMMPFASDTAVSLTIMGLIVSGGLGFIVLSDLARYVFSKTRKRLSLHSRVVMIMTGLLITSGALLITAFESGNQLMNLPWTGRILTPLFQSITARTAGFNTLDIAHLTSPCLFIIMLLMVIGASPGSTGGGIKTTTAAILLGLVRSQALGRNEVEISGRRLPGADVARALATFSMYVLTLGLGVVALLIIQGWHASSPELHDDFMRILFEAISALSTVGLSMDYTTHLAPMSRIVVILLMLCGRLGPISVVLTFVGQTRAGRYEYPEESVMTG